MKKAQLDKLREHQVNAECELIECRKICRDTGLLYELADMGLRSVAVMGTALDSIQGRNELSRWRELYG